MKPFADKPPVVEDVIYLMMAKNTFDFKIYYVFHFVNIFISGLENNFYNQVAGQLLDQVNGPQPNNTTWLFYLKGLEEYETK